MKLVFMLIIVCVTHILHAQNDPNLKTFRKAVYQLQYQPSWRLDTSKIMGTELFLFAPLENAADKFSENINVLIQDLSGQNITLEDYKEITEKQIREMVVDGKIFESTIRKTEEVDYYLVTYEMTQQKTRLKITSKCFIKNEKAYLATFTTEFDKYDQYKKTGEAMINSFVPTM